MPEGGRRPYPYMRTKYDESALVAPDQNYSTPHQKVLSGSIGIEKAAGMGKTTRIGISSMGNHAKKTKTKMSGGY